MDLFYLTCILGLLIPHSVALQVTPNSPCASFCLDSEGDDVSDPNSSATRNKDITCYDSKYTSSPAGRKFQGCMSCLQDSTFSQGSESDQLWFLYNLRYTFDYCIFGFPNAVGVPSTPCSTSTACGAVRAALTKDSLSADFVDYSYCDVDGGVITSPTLKNCISCVDASEDQRFLVNYLVALEAGCSQRPSAGEVLGLSDTVFSTAEITAIDSDSTATESNQASLSTPTIVGIAIGAVAVILAIAGFFFVLHRRRRNRRLRLEGGASQGSGPGRGRHNRASSLSFRCRAHLSPRSPAFFPNSSDSAVEEEKGYRDSNVAFGPHLTDPEPRASRASPESWQPQPSVSSSSFTRPRSVPRPLQNISTSGAPTIPDHVHYSTSPKALCFSPYEEVPAGSSRMSTGSTAHVPHLRPYNPADYVVSSPGLGSPGLGTPVDAFSYASPVSASTASPLLSRPWERHNQDAISPIWEEMAPREAAIVARPKSGGALERRIGVPLSPGGRKRTSGTGTGTGGPVESREISMNFPGPPSPGARWGWR
ncbi:hypothetical protein F4802DRAFT_447240 [Xylaria palmicola]|nr:hypothetical protein F4802DRAFT_447240 [Xylaria palmicola]